MASTSSSIMEARSRTFQRLKPPCVQLNEASLKFRLGKISGNELTASVEQLLSTLQEECSSHSSLDAKLADYVFFPLSQVLQERRTVPVRTLEFVLRCLDLLLQSGWRSDLNADFVVQLLILLTYLAGFNKDSKEKLSTSDELQTLAFVCQKQLLKSLGKTRSVADVFLQTQYVPALGHAITVMLEGSKDGASRDVQSAALDSLQSFFDCFADREMLASFFPGVVSSLTQVLTPTTKVRRHFRVLEKALTLLAELLHRLLADAELVQDTLTGSVSAQVTISLQGKDASWLAATASQIKLALANVVRLRSHDRDEVSSALSKLCWTVLQDCQPSLRESNAMMLQTLVSLAEQSLAEQNSKTCEALAHLIATDVNMANLLRDSLYDWLISLSRIMLSNDEAAKKKTIAHIAKAYSFLVDADVDMSMIDGIIMSTLADSLANAIRTPDSAGFLTQASVVSTLSAALVNVAESEPSTKFDMALTRNQKGVEVISDLQYLVHQVAGSSGALHMARDSLETARASEGQDRLVQLWLSLTILKMRASEDVDVGFDAYVETEPSSTSESELCEDLYAFAVTLLSQELDVDNPDWRHQALALEVFALQAIRLKSDFRTELVDALYPMVHLMASQHQGLRNHALTCLNIIAVSCGYAHTQDLVVSNVDYIVNAVGAKLNTFDLSPEAPQVLLMMIKLCGPILLPYLDDLINSVFDALECFHGYPSLVEMLFTVLRGVVEEGTKAPQFTITMGDGKSHRKTALTPTTFDQMVSWLAARRERSSKMNSLDDMDAEIQENERKAKLKQYTEDGEADPDADNKSESLAGDQPATSNSDDGPPLTTTYNILQRITSLTQHHIPSSSPSIRFSLISLLATALPYLSRHEDTFLPLVHILWPVLIPRLEDKEAYVIAGILDVIGAICEGAGDFVGARIDGLWATIRRVWRMTRMTSHAGHDARGKILGRSEKRQLSRSTVSVQPQHELVKPRPSGVQLSLAEVSNVLMKSSESSINRSPTSHNDFHTTTSDSDSHRNAYTPTTTLTVRAAMTRFLVQLLHHVRISEALYAEILSDMLYDALVLEKREDVREALAARNPDAVWLVLERAKWEGRPEAGAEWWRQRMPEERGSRRFREVVV